MLSCCALWSKAVPTCRGIETYDIIVWKRIVRLGIICILRQLITIPNITLFRFDLVVMLDFDEYVHFNKDTTTSRRKTLSLLTSLLSPPVFRTRLRISAPSAVHIPD